MRYSRGILAGLRRVEEEVSGIQRMLEEGRPCEDMITRIMDARADLDRVALSVVAARMEECLVEPQSSEVKKATIERSLTLFLRMSPAASTTVIR